MLPRKLLSLIINFLPHIWQMFLQLSVSTERKLLLLTLHINCTNINFWHFLSFILFFAVTIKLKSREVTVKGPRGTLVRNFRHLNLELTLVGKKKLRVDVWFAKRKELACVKTICSHIENMIKGVIYVSTAVVNLLLKQMRFARLWLLILKQCLSCRFDTLVKP